MRIQYKPVVKPTYKTPCRCWARGLIDGLFPDLVPAAGRNVSEMSDIPEYIAGLMFGADDE